MLAELFSETGIIVILVVVVVLFGSTQLPKLARSLGSAQTEFKKGLAEGNKDGKNGTTAAAAPATLPAPTLPTPAPPAATAEADLPVPGTE